MRKNGLVFELREQDTDTAAIFTEIARGIDKWLWLVSTSQQPGS